MPFRLPLLVLFATTALACSAPAALAITREVTTTVDSSPGAPLIPGSLRYAVSRAHDGDVIHVPSGFYALDRELKTTQSITIRGDGARTTVLNGQDQDRLFEMTGGSSSTAVLIGLTIEHGRAEFGAGVDGSDGTLWLVDDAIIANSANSFGSGVFTNGTLNVNRVLLAGNRSGTAVGGAIATITGTVGITDSTITKNSASGSGGGIYQQYGTLSLVSDTIVDNTATGSSPHGGALYSTGAYVSIKNTAISRGSGSPGQNCAFSGTTLDDFGQNADGSADTCALYRGDDVLTDDLKLGALQDNGGPTDSMMPVSGSPLINAGGVTATDCTGTDQRGANRPVGGRCDIGSVEFGSTPPPLSGSPVSGSAQTGASVAPPAALRLSGASLTSTRFRVSPLATSRVARADTPVGTTFRLTLSAKARVRIALVGRVPGLRDGHGRCVAPSTSLRASRAARCTRMRTSGTLQPERVAGGRIVIPFSGRIGRRALAPGRYVATITARNEGGSAKPVRLRFVITR